MCSGKAAGSEADKLKGKQGKKMQCLPQSAKNVLCRQKKAPKPMLPSSFWFTSMTSWPFLGSSVVFGPTL